MSTHSSVSPTRNTLLLLTLASLGAVACSDSAAPAPPLAVPAFAYVADVDGYATLMRYHDGVTTQLTTGSNNTEPNAVGTRMVFTSTRDVMPQIYISDLAVTTVRRVTVSKSFDMTAALSPATDSIAFVSTRSGTPRIWLINAPALDDTNFYDPIALETGSPDYVPESAPAWSPVGGLIAYTSTKDGVSQVYVIASGGGTPLRITNEMGGAFQPTWAPDGASLYYVAATPQIVLKHVSSAGGPATTIIDGDYDGDVDVGGPISCGAGVCVFASSPDAEGGEMFAMPLTAGKPTVLFPRSAAMERQPTILAQ